MPLLATTAFGLDPTLPKPGSRRPTPTSAPPPPAAVTPAPASPSQAAPSSLPATSAKGSDEPSAAPTQRSPIPDANAQREANRVVDQIYKESIAAAKSPDQRKALGQKFFKLAQETTTDMPGRYVLLIRARDLATDAGDIETTLASIAETERSFVIEAGVSEMEIMNRLQKNLRGPEAHKTLARYLLGAANDAVAADRFEGARRFADLAVSDANRANDPNLLKMATSRAKEIREIEQAYTQANAALAAIAKGSTEPADALAAGKYKCLYKGDWTGGLPLLATGSDTALKDLAIKELSGVAGADQQISVADAWWDEADKLTGVPKNLATVRARYWYEQAEPFLTGLPKAKAQKRLKESESLALLYGPKGAPAHPSTPGNAAAGSPTAATPSAQPVASQIKLNGKFTRAWKAPEIWVNKPELVTIKENKVTILNEGGTNTVCKDEEFTTLPDGSLALQWNYGESKSGYEVWSMQGGEIVISRWNTKEEKEAGKQARRVGFVSK
jgi:hypothetical protein